MHLRSYFPFHEVGVAAYGIFGRIKQSPQVFDFLLRFPCAQTLYYLCAFGDDACDFFSMCDCGVGDALVLELYRVAEALVACLFYVTLVDAIILRLCGNVLSIQRMERPCTAFVCLLVDLDLATQWRQWHIVVVKWAAQVDLG